MQIIGGTCVFITSESLFFLAVIVWCCGYTLLYCLVSSAGGLWCKQLSKGNLLHSPFQKHSLFLHEPVSLSMIVFLTAPAQALFSDSPPPSHTHTHKKYPCSYHQWSCPTTEPIVYWGFRWQWGRNNPAGLLVSLTPLSQWVPLPSHSFPCQAGKSKYLSAPTTMSSLEEKETLTRANARAVGKAAVIWGLKIGCRNIKVKSLIW